MPPIKESLKHIDKKVKNSTQHKKISSKKKHKEYGTSKLEEKFARDFLDTLGVKYMYQFKAESIGRYFDFFIPESRLIIEIDGIYWHSKDVEYDDMNPTQKHNKRVDEQKNHWCKINCYPILRIWEDDINKHPEKVMQVLKEQLHITREQKEINDNKKKRH